MYLILSGLGPGLLAGNRGLSLEKSGQVGSGLDETLC